MKTLLFALLTLTACYGMGPRPVQTPSERAWLDCRARTCPDGETRRVLDDECVCWRAGK